MRDGHVTQIVRERPKAVRFPRLAALVCALLLPMVVIAQPMGKSFDTPQALVANSKLVVRGKLLSVESDPTQSFIADWAKAVFEVKEYLKGTGPKTLVFEIKGANNGDLVVHDHVRSGAEVIGFFCQSLSFHSLKASRYRYAPRTGNFRGSFIDLAEGSKTPLLSEDLKEIAGPGSVISAVKAAITATQSGKYKLEARKVDPQKVPIAFRAPWVYVNFAVPDASRAIGQPDQAARFHPGSQYDGDRILLADGKRALLWDATTGRLIQKFEGSKEDIQAVSFCPPEPFDPPKGRILTGSGRPGGILGTSKDNGLRLWDIEKGTIQLELGPIMGPLVSVAYSPTGKLMSYSEESSDYDRDRQRFWETFGKTEVALIPGFGATFSPDGAMVVSGARPYVAREYFARIYDLSNFLQLAALPADRQYWSYAFSTFGNKLVTTSTSGMNHYATEIWDAETGTKTLELDGSHGRQAAFDQDMTIVVTAEHNSGLAVWTLATGKRIRDISLPKVSRHFILTPDATRCLAMWGYESNYWDDLGGSLIDVTTGRELLRLDQNPQRIIGFSADWKTICVLGPDKRSATIIDVSTGKVVRKLELMTQ